jgi:hypothetical protein
MGELIVVTKEKSPPVATGGASGVGFQTLTDARSTID